MPAAKFAGWRNPKVLMFMKGHILGGECSDTTAPSLQNNPAIMIVMTKYLDENVAFPWRSRLCFPVFLHFWS